MKQEIQDQLDGLKADVQAERDQVTAAETLIQGLKTSLDQALASSQDPAEIVAAVQELRNGIEADTSGLAAAVSANTPAAPASTGTDTGTGSDTTGAGSDTGTGPQPGDATDPTA